MGVPTWLCRPISIFSLMGKYIECHRPTPPVEGFEDYVFLTPGGRSVSHLSEDLTFLSKDFPTELGVLHVSTMDMHKLTATSVTGSSSDNTMCIVVSHMSHVSKHQKKYYQHIQSEENSAQVYVSEKRRVDHS